MIENRNTQQPMFTEEQDQEMRADSYVNERKQKKNQLGAMSPSSRASAQPSETRGKPTSIQAEQPKVRVRTPEEIREDNKDRGYY